MSRRELDLPFGHPSFNSEAQLMAKLAQYASGQSQPSMTNNEDVIRELHQLMMLTHQMAVVLVAAVKDIRASNQRLELQMTQQSDDLAAVVAKAETTFGLIDAEIKALQAAAAASPTQVDPGIANSIARLSTLNDTMAKDLPAVAPAATAAVAAAAV